MKETHIKKVKEKECTQYIFRLLGYCVLCVSISEDVFWFKFIGYGIKRVSKSSGLSFGQRIGQAKYIMTRDYIYTFI